MTSSGRLAQLRTFLTQLGQLTRPYFRSEQKWQARGLLAAIVALNLAAVYMLVQINEWNRVFFDALQTKDQNVFWAQLGRFTWLAMTFIVIAVYRFYLTQLLQLRWRAWMTRELMQRWLSNHAFYRLELVRHVNAAQAHAVPADNPDQRLQEDVHLFTSQTVNLSMGLLNAVVTLGSFVGMLWTLSGSFSFQLGGSSFTITGFMVWMALLYCLVGSVLTHRIGRPLVGLNFAQQKLEADYRHHLMRVREYSEAIALDRGAAVENRNLDTRFGAVLRNYLQLIGRQKRLVGFTNLFGQAAVVFPFLIAAPRFFSGAIQLGELMQIGNAFDRVQTALSWFVDHYDELASWRATTERLTSFSAALAQSKQPSASVEWSDSAMNSAAIDVHDLSLRLPDGTLLIGHASLQATPGQHTLLQGPSGSGKSTLFRALAGIWPWAEGRVTLPPDAMFIPQRPYVPDGSLRDALAYPGPASAYHDDVLRQALQDALLPELAEQLDRHDAWTQKLSGGELQRLAVARVLLRRPAWVLADEASSALDAAAEQRLYQTLHDRTAQAGGALISIAHRSSIAAFHRRTWQLVPNTEATAPKLGRFTIQTHALPTTV